jgi:hypothetical protein
VAPLLGTTIANFTITLCTVFSIIMVKVKKGKDAPTTTTTTTTTY